MERNMADGLACSRWLTALSILAILGQFGASGARAADVLAHHYSNASTRATLNEPEYHQCRCRKVWEALDALC
jgi:hypothetical protein